MSDTLTLRPASAADWPAMWAIFHAVVAGGDSYVFAPDTSESDARDYWFGPGIASWVVCDGARVVGQYKLVANQRDLGNHVANASFMVAPDSHGRGIGEAMGRHCLREAKCAGYTAMQFNFVVASNHGAVALWQKLGFTIVGTLPRAYRHATLGLVDAYVMYRFLDDIAN
ncbi:GNAT family N-acetyltransferase [Neisseriaceae bacterium JH1-16]|nr:GNAT family N-acetyltransferase [Neisseriaceae bacterium JH1-16]